MENVYVRISEKEKASLYLPHGKSSDIEIRGRHIQNITFERY